MTSNWLYIEGKIRGESTYEYFLKAKSIDGVKKNFNAWIDRVVKEQNNKEAKVK